MLHDKELIAFIPTVDAEKAKAFYTGVLGLLLIRDDGHALVYEAGAVMLRVTRVQAFTPHPFTALGWEVPDIVAMVAALRERGVAFEQYGFPTQDKDGIWTVPGATARVAWFKDPDGNLLSITQMA